MYDKIHYKLKKKKHKKKKKETTKKKNKIKLCLHYSLLSVQ